MANKYYTQSPWVFSVGDSIYQPESENGKLIRQGTIVGFNKMVVPRVETYQSDIRKIKRFDLEGNIYRMQPGIYLDKENPVVSNNGVETILTGSPSFNPHYIDNAIYQSRINGLSRSISLIARISDLPKTPYIEDDIVIVYEPGEDHIDPNDAANQLEKDRFDGIDFGPVHHFHKNPALPYQLCKIYAIEFDLKDPKNTTYLVGYGSERTFITPKSEITKKAKRNLEMQNLKARYEKRRGERFVDWGGVTLFRRKAEDIELLKPGNVGKYWNNAELDLCTEGGHSPSAMLENLAYRLGFFEEVCDPEGRGWRTEALTRFETESPREDPKTLLQRIRDFIESGEADVVYNNDYGPIVQGKRCYKVYRILEPNLKQRLRDLKAKEEKVNSA